MTLDNGAHFSVQYYVYNQPETIEYSGMEWNVTTGTLKFTTQISDWPFASTSNRLRIL
jgi:hypothetical protein